MNVEEPDDGGYRGVATVRVAGRELDVTVRLRGRFQPIDGRYHWYGRIAADQRLTDLLGGRNATAVLRTPHGDATGRLSDQDTWGRYRISGTGRPPFEVATALDSVRADG